MGGRERPSLPGAGRQRTDCGLLVAGRRKRTVWKPAGQGSPTGRVCSWRGGDRGRAPSSPSIRICAPQHGSSPSAAAARSSRSTAGYPSYWAPRALEEQGEASPGLGATRPRLPRWGREVAGQGWRGRGKGRAGENGGVTGVREETQHSRPAPRVAPPQRDRGGTDALGTPAPGRSRGAAGGGLKGNAALCLRRRSFPPSLRGGGVLEVGFYTITENPKLAETHREH